MTGKWPRDWKNSEHPDPPEVKREGWLQYIMYFCADYELLERWQKPKIRNNKLSLVDTVTGAPTRMSCIHTALQSVLGPAQSPQAGIIHPCRLFRHSGTKKSPHMYHTSRLECARNQRAASCPSCHVSPISPLKRHDLLMSQPQRQHYVFSAM